MVLSEISNIIMNYTTKKVSFSLFRLLIISIISQKHERFNTFPLDFMMELTFHDFYHTPQLSIAYPTSTLSYDLATKIEK
jgi:hypothetical protein